MTTLVTLWIVMAGMFGFWNLPISALPKIEFPVIQVTASLPGANPVTMAQAVALPLEQQFSSISGLEAMTSTSAQGTSLITLQFALDVNINAAAQDVGTAISTAQVNLPPNMPSLPIYKKVNPAEQPIIFLAVTSPTLPLWQVNQYAQNYVVDRLSMIRNVAQVSVIGEQKYAVRVYVRPEILKSRNLSLVTVANLISQSNINAPTGLLQGPVQVQSLTPNSQLKNADEFSQIMIPNHDGLRLKDVAEVVDDVENLYSAAWFNNERGIILSVRRQPGSNTLEVAESIKEVLPSIEKQLPQSVKMTMLLDRSEPIQESVNDVEFTCILTISLVVLVIFLFLRSAQATLIPTVTLPISMIATFALMSALDFSLNNLTLLALTLATGFIIDDAIVVLENITRYREQGLSALDATLKGTEEIGFTVISMTLSLVAVFIPILFMPGIVGRLLFEFSFTLIIVILMSGVVSLTLTPMMCRYLMKVSSEESENNFYKILRISFERLEFSYKNSLQWVMKRQNLILAGTGIIFIINVAFYLVIPKGFFPNEDMGLIYGVTDVGPEASFDAMEIAQKKLMEIITNQPEVENYNTSIGTSTTTVAQNEGRIFIKLKSIETGRKSIEKVMNDLREKFNKIPDVTVSLQAIQNLRVGGTLSKSQYQYTIQAQNLEDLNSISSKFLETLGKTPGFLDVNSDLQINSLQVNVKIDRDRASYFGITVKDITDTLYSAFGDRQVSTIYTDIDTYQVILAVRRSEAQSLKDLDQIYVPNNKDELIPLSSFASMERVNAPLTVNHLNRFSAATISFNLAPNISLGQAIDQIRHLETEFNLPPTVSTSFQGTALAFQKSQGGQVWLLLAAIVTIYIILGILYESYIHPVTILTGLPSAGLGALVALMLLGFNLDVIGIIGIILLMGIVKKNAIMMIDYALTQQRENNLSSQDAIIEACQRRFRPIMMTTFAAIMGAVPIAFGMGAGAELRRPLGICIIGGLLLSQWLTLYITPVFYIWMEKKFGEKGQRL
ncbi:MAG: efflux RND transporter permease subunit [Alphaproteobacteria bacterium]|nr:efflux RND transporter permease subunit [Alphaproteobacteria bacterium]